MIINKPCEVLASSNVNFKDVWEQTNQHTTNPKRIHRNRQAKILQVLK